MDRPNLAIRHNISDEELLIRQHESLSAQIQRLHSQQPSLKAFVQTQREQAFPDVRPLNAETTQHAITKDIATQYPKSLQAFWTTPRPKEREPRTLEAPQNQLLTLHKQQLSVLAALRVSDGTLTPASKQLIDAALQHPTLAEREHAFANGARPGVYPITVDDGTERGALLAGAFLITKTDNSWATEPTWPNGRALPLNDANGPVVLYTPGEGFEEFTTPAQARQALADRLEQGGATADLLLQQMPLAMQNRDDPPPGMT